ncbi:MAG: N-acetyltransferase [Bacteroidales bacterium]|nr:N-acetyltransferase [Bacteroidales bacterium]
MVRFGWIDFIDDAGVVRALVDAVVAWGKARGCTRIKGPLGFSDMDKEGLLVEGFDQLAPFTVIYNYPYYGPRLEELGFVKDADWTQKIVDIPDVVPQVQYAALVEKRFGLRAVSGMSMKAMGRRYGKELFHLINTAFAELYEYTPMSDRQIDGYLKSYLSILNPDFVSIIVDADDHVAGFAITVPSLSRAFRKARGRLFPFGFIPILRALRKTDTIEALLIGVLPQYQGKGASIMIFKDLLESCHRYGVTRMLANPQLETNKKVQSVFSDIFETHEFMRRRSYAREIG